MDNLRVQAAALLFGGSFHGPYTLSGTFLSVMFMEPFWNRF